MLFLRTGLPGSGKTLNTIKEIDEEHQCDPDNPSVRLHKDVSDPSLPPRTIYYHGIPELKIDKLKAKWVEFDHPDTWFELPDGCVIVIDEAQGTFGTDVRGRVDKVTKFETHRHHGWDVHIITQHPSLVCQPVRKLVGKHINFIRPYGRTKGVFRHEYEMCIDRPEKRSNFQLAQESKIEFDPHYFGLYKSATVHTHKKVTPKHVKLIPILILFILSIIGLFVFGTYKIMHSRDDKAAAPQPADTQVQQQPPTPGTAIPRVPSSNMPATVEQYSEDNTPRIKDIPASAPRYDAVNKPRDFPRPMCVSSSDPEFVSTAQARGLKVGRFENQTVSCQCYTQQVTRMDTSIEFCMNVVRNGYFDDTQPQRQIATSNARGLETKSRSDASEGLGRGRAAGAPSDVSSTDQFARVTVVEDSGRRTR